jgi:membrane-associated phospholipid phosphatase
MKTEILTGLSLLAYFISFSQNDTLPSPNDTLLKGPDTLQHHIIVNQPAFSAPKVQKVYRIRPAVDVPLTVIGTGWSLYAFTRIYSKDTSTTEQILSLDKNDLAAINQPCVNQYSPRASDISNIFFYGAMPYPLVLLADKHIRKDAAKVIYLYLEAMSVTGLLYTGSVYFVDKYRPYTYNPDVPLDRRKGGGGKNSFYAGHVALVGTSTFFTAKVFSDYHPYSKMKWLFYGVAGVATGTTAYLRYQSGEHFITDIFIGTVQGILTGILVPQLHKALENSNLSLIPYVGKDKGLAITYRF